MPTQKQVHDYVMGALNYLLRDRVQLVSMVCLHFAIDYDSAKTMVDIEVKALRYNPFAEGS